MTKTTLPPSFETLVQTSPKPVLVDFWAEWCGPCRTLSPVIGELAKEFGDRMLTVKVNVDQKPDIASAYGIQSIPTIVLFWQGRVLWRQSGVLPIEALRNALQQKLPVMN